MPMPRVSASAQPHLTEEIAVEVLRDFFREKPFLFIGSGMSAALDVRFGMPALRDELLKRIPDYDLATPEKEQWVQVQQGLESGADLESSLNAVTDSELLKKITVVTGKFIGSLDREYALRISNDESKWPALDLLKLLVDTLPPADPILHVLTTNYDMLLEHSCDYVRITYANGFFGGGVERRIDWAAAEHSLTVPRRTLYRGKLRTTYAYRNHIRLYKVHGSLNYFFHRSSFIENNSWIWNPPQFAQRVMIPPGLSKYEMLHRYRQELLQPADAAIEKANRFLFLGYGFNDTHLEEYIKRKLVTQGCMGLILTRSSNERMESLLSKARNLWLVCSSESEDGTRISNQQYSTSLYLPGRRLWDIREFTNSILGG